MATVCRFCLIGYNDSLKRETKKHGYVRAFSIIQFSVVLFSGIFFSRLFFLSPNMVFDAADACLPGAVGAAEKSLFGFDAVTDNSAAAVRANGRELMNRAFKRIENVPLARRNNFKR
jgi:hypothetical protein